MGLPQLYLSGPGIGHKLSFVGEDLTGGIVREAVPRFSVREGPVSDPLPVTRHDLRQRPGCPTSCHSGRRADNRYHGHKSLIGCPNAKAGLGWKPDA